MTRSSRRSVLAGAVALSLAMMAPAAYAADVDMAAAKKEGKVVWYTSTPIETAQKIANLFEAKHGIKVELFRSGGSAILRRFQQEMQAGRIACDVLTTSDPAASEQFARKGVFVAFKPTDFDKVPKEARNEDGYFVAQRLNMMTIYMRSDKVAPADQPKTWAQLVDPKYKGKLVTTDPSFTSLQLSVIGMMSKKLGWDYFEKLRQNDIMIVQGNQQVSDNIKRAERVIAVGASDSYAADDRKDGHPILTVYPEDGTFMIPSPTAVVKGSPNPNAAKAFADFMLTMEVQSLFPGDGGYAARLDVPAPDGSPPLSSLKISAVDYDFIEKEGQRIKKKFTEVFQ
ncbi:ABC transporter substrate-binding protein [Alsobacter metallidurans]|uniref:ABC transporter substrate-binding protein n=1 Tax=Alsobacter metallidurans TaxID=340221 RepID=UPI001663A6C7|nr:ABC transporter substrate-binding protein [Alsobacter metallidurans]